MAGHDLNHGPMRSCLCSKIGHLPVHCHVAICVRGIYWSALDSRHIKLRGIAPSHDKIGQGCCVNSPASRNSFLSCFPFTLLQASKCSILILLLSSFSHSAAGRKRGDGVGGLPRPGTAKPRVPSGRADPSKQHAGNRHAGHGRAENRHGGHGHGGHSPAGKQGGERGSPDKVCLEAWRPKILSFVQVRVLVFRFCAEEHAMGHINNNSRVIENMGVKAGIAREAWRPLIPGFIQVRLHMWGPAFIFYYSSTSSKGICLRGDKI